MKHLTLMFSIFVFPLLDQFQFTPGKLGAGQEPWCHTYGGAREVEPAILQPATSYRHTAAFPSSNCTQLHCRRELDIYYF